MGGTPEDPRARWDRRYRESERRPGPARVLTDYAHLLPAAGDALDLACGLGANARFLAARGLRVRAWDLSPVAIARAGERARAEGLSITAEVRDVSARPPEPERFDLIVVSRFLDRALAPALHASLRRGGLLYYQTFTRTHVTPTGPRSEDYRLADNELLTLFAGLQVVAYREEGRLGDLTRGFRDEAMLVAQRR